MSRQRNVTAKALSFTAMLAATTGLSASPPERSELSSRERDELARYARDTWRSIDAMRMPCGLPCDHLTRRSDGTWRPSSRTSPTDIASYLWSVVAAQELGILSDHEARQRFEKSLTVLGRLERDHGLFINKYDPRTGGCLRVWPEAGQPVRRFLSSVDNGWLALALIVIRNRESTLRERADALLAPMNFAFFYDPYDPTDPLKHPGLLHGLYWVDDRAFAYHYGMLNSETRIASYIAIARRQVPAEHYFRMFRTPPEGLFRQRPAPEGVFRTYLGIPVFEGHYAYRDMNIVPSWGGSMFEALMVHLFVPETRWAPESWGINHPLYVRAQIEHGLDEARYGFWGFSPCERPEGGYDTYGVDDIGASPDGYTSYNDGAHSAPEFTNGIVTPHAVFLALPFAPHEAMDNLRSLAARFSTYSPYGFFDSVNVSTGLVSQTVLVLDQGMIMAAIANALKDDVMQHAFSDGPIEASIRPLIAQERFTAGPAISATTPLPRDPRATRPAADQRAVGRSASGSRP
jgi:hypothetical protein